MCTCTEIHNVHVALEQLFLGEALFQRECVSHLTQFPDRRLSTSRLKFLCVRRLIHEDVLHVLHRQGGATLLDIPSSGVRQGRTQRAAHIDTVVIKEACIFYCDGCLSHDRGNGTEWNLDAVLVIQGRQVASVIRQDRALLRKRWRLDGVRKAFKLLDGISRHNSDATDHWHGHRGDDGSRDDRDEDKAEQPSDDRPRPSLLYHAHRTSRVRLMVPSDASRTPQ